MTMAIQRTTGLPVHAVGLLALSPSGKVLYRNSEAERFCVQLSSPERERPVRGLPQAIESAVVRLHRNELTPGKPIRVEMGDKDPLMLRAFLIAGTGSRKPPIIIVLMEHWRETDGKYSGLVESDMQLTERERDVVGCLTKGFTNKEIAVALQISEPTVKAHVRHIMVKSHTSTRTGLLACVLGWRSEPPGHRLGLYETGHGSRGMLRGSDSATPLLLRRVDLKRSCLQRFSGGTRRRERKRLSDPRISSS
jgi:DNA-binding CsgD family transcriptional regulator